MKVPEPFNYKILKSAGSAELERLVIEAMDEGFTPLGGVSRSDDEHDAFYAQAVGMFSSDGDDEPQNFETALFNIEELLKRLVDVMCQPSDSQPPEK